MIDPTVIAYAIGQLDSVIYVKWGVFVLLSVILIIVLRGQNKRLGIIVNEQGNREPEKFMLQTAIARGHVAAFLWMLLCGFLVASDISKETDKLFSEPTYEQHDSSITPAPPETKQETAQPEATIPPKKDDAEHINELKASYEDAFVSYMVLKRCDKAQDADYQALYNALTQKLAEHNAPISMAHNVMIAASGSYQALYSDTPCENSYLDPVEESFTDFLKNIAGN